ncbi:Afadin and alpha-actinin-binding-domain-containing protein [Tuber borchii]|uniref:Afadin and alpha-actinin-binding-domain-containing protein n=1 Tax=Tuber borchii TaxID=42251 RepID=A0A2T6ZF46_TUBBO|nr:Afadin and alpha-actinin-binding-domain-containing protein [Tuber borchii]
MDPRDLKSASTYVNNQLAARGLLRGNPIPFHKPGEDDSTPAKIINLVHELIARRDREGEQREDLALTIRTLRTTEVKQNETIEQLKEKNRELERKNAILDSQTRSFNSTLRTVEASANALRHEAARLKTLLAQVRTQCANDIRKRDIQIQKMKERLTDSSKRGRAPMAHITVIGASKGSVLGGGEDGTATTAAGNSLAADTTDFLTTLSQGLADENDNLIALIRQTLSTLKTIQGLPDDDGLHATQEDAEDAENPVAAPPASFDALSDDLEGVLYSLKELLNQPNYVPLEELAERDAEIARLVAKNETLEKEWKKAIELVDGWNKTLGRKFDKERAKESKVPAKERKRGQRALADIVNSRNDAAAPEEEEKEEEKEVADKPVEGETRAECANDRDEDMSDVQLLVVEESKPAEPTRRRSLRNKEKKPKQTPSPKSIVKKKRKSTRKTRSFSSRELESLVS